MSLANVRAALDARLEAYTPALSIAWENQGYKPAVGSAFVKVDLLPARTENPEFGAGANDVRVLRGIYQLRLNHPVNAGPSAAAALADALVAHFARGSSYTYGGTTVRLLKTPSVAPAYPDGAWYVTPISVEYRAEIYPT